MHSHVYHFCNELYNNSFAFAVSGNWLNLAMRSSRVKTAYGPRDRRVDQLPTIALTAVHLPSRVFPLPHREQLCSSTAPTQLVYVSRVTSLDKSFQSHSKMPYFSLPSPLCYIRLIMLDLLTLLAA